MLARIRREVDAAAVGAVTSAAHTRQPTRSRRWHVIVRHAFVSDTGGWNTPAERVRSLVVQNGVGGGVGTRSFWQTLEMFDVKLLYVPSKNRKMRNGKLCSSSAQCATDAMAVLPPAGAALRAH